MGREGGDPGGPGVGVGGGGTDCVLRQQHVQYLSPHLQINIAGSADRNTRFFYGKSIAV